MNSNRIKKILSDSGSKKKSSSSKEIEMRPSQLDQDRASRDFYKEIVKEIRENLDALKSEMLSKPKQGEQGAKEKLDIIENVLLDQAKEHILRRLDTLALEKLTDENKKKALFMIEKSIKEICLQRIDILRYEVIEHLSLYIESLPVLITHGTHGDRAKKVREQFYKAITFGEMKKILENQQLLFSESDQYSQLSQVKHREVAESKLTKRFASSPPKNINREGYIKAIEASLDECLKAESYTKELTDAWDMFLKGEGFLKKALPVGRSHSEPNLRKQLKKSGRFYQLSSSSSSEESSSEEESASQKSGSSPDSGAGAEEKDPLLRPSSGAKPSG